METQIEQIKQLHPDWIYDEGRLYDQNYDLVESDVNVLIEEYYDQCPVAVGHSTHNPALELDEVVSGRDFIKREFGGDYREAFESI